MNKEAQKELMRHYVSVQKFIDDTIDFIRRIKFQHLQMAFFRMKTRIQQNQKR